MGYSNEYVRDRFVRIYRDISRDISPKKPEDWETYCSQAGVFMVVLNTLLNPEDTNFIGVKKLLANHSDEEIARKLLQYSLKDDRHRFGDYAGIGNWEMPQNPEEIIMQKKQLRHDLVSRLLEKVA